MTIDLNDIITEAAVKALMENITYSNSSDAPDVSRNVTLCITDGAFSSTAITAINITQENDAPTELFLSHNEIDENAENATVIGTITSVDPDGSGGLTYTLMDDAEGRFSVNAVSGVLSVADSTALDFESLASHAIIVRVTDSASAFFDSAFTININDLSDTSPENIFVKDNTKEIFEHHFARETFDISYERDRVVYHSFVRNYLHNNLASISITKHYVDAQKFSMNFPEILKGPFILSCDKDYVNIDKMFQDRHQDNALFQNRIIDFEPSED